MEWAEFTGNLYGTPRAAVNERLAAGTPVLLEIELQGARQIKETMPGSIRVFLLPPSWEELERRLVGRGTEPGDLRDQRLAAARVELAAQGEFDHTLVNSSVQESVDQLVRLMGVDC